jgi:hypothetical protein
MSIHSSTFLEISSFASPLMRRCVPSRSSNMNFLSVIFWSFRCMMNCFMGGSQVRRYPDDRAGLLLPPPPPGADGEEEAAGRFDLACVNFDLDDDMMMSTEEGGRVTYYVCPRRFYSVE